jgi:hypothetical protein
MTINLSLPIHYRAFIQLGCHNDHLFHWIVQPIKERAGRCSKGLTTCFAFVACFFSAVNNDVVPAYFAPYWASHIWAE